MPFRHSRGADGDGDVTTGASGLRNGPRALAAPPEDESGAGVSADPRKVLVSRQGLEPRTRYVDATASEDGIARILPADSNPDAADSRFEADADVIQLPTWRNQPGVIREAVAR